MAVAVQALEFVGILSEILTFVGLIIGAILYLVGLSVRGISGRFTRTNAVIALSSQKTVIRWFDNEGEVHECPADTHESHQLVPGDDVRVWFRTRQPERCRTHDPALDGKGLRLTGLVLLALGVAAAIVGIVLMFF